MVEAKGNMHATELEMQQEIELSRCRCRSRSTNNSGKLQHGTTADTNGRNHRWAVKVQVSPGYDSLPGEAMDVTEAQVKDRIKRGANRKSTCAVGKTAAMTETVKFELAGGDLQVATGEHKRSCPTERRAEAAQLVIPSR